MIEVRLIENHENFLNDVQDVPRAFSPYLIVNEDAEHYLKWEYQVKNNEIEISIFSDFFKNKAVKIPLKYSNILEYKKKIKHAIKIELYKYLSDELQINLPYGSLTGVRPTKLYYELLEKEEQPIQSLVKNYFVSEEKSNLIADCVKNQENFINRNPNKVGIFVNIPFCPSRCKYCSFISTEVFRVKKELPIYVENVKKEIEKSFEILERKGYSVGSIYFGGGTPSSIGSELLDKLLSPFKELNVEFTVEAGRPDAIDRGIVDTLLRNNVTRVSVNPQTFHNKTLELIGRKHTVENFLDCYCLIKNAGFSVNTDLIAGLQGESFEDFSYSIQRCLDLLPDNITVHSLSIKRGSDLKSAGAVKEEYGKVSEMISYAHSALIKAGYVPYYLYRQKNMADNLENTGYCLPGKQCVYNIDMMEESATIIGIGAGAMTKLVERNRIERLSDPKGFREYNERIDSILQKKTFFFNL